MLTAELILQSGSSTQTFELPDGKPLFAGRTLECDLQLRSPAVSRRHAVFLARGNQCGVKDLGSSNGTYLNGKRITKAMRLRNGDVIHIAEYTIRFKQADVSDFQDADRTVIMDEVTKNATPAVLVPAPSESSSVAVEHKKTTISSRRLGIAASEPADDTPFSVGDLPPPMGDSPEDEGALSSDDDFTRELEESGSFQAVSGAAETPPEPEGARREPVPADAPAAPASPPSPPRPDYSAISDEEVGDGSADDAFAMEEEEPEDETDRHMALSKAAAEAGLVGEFTPDVPEESPGGGNGGEGAAAGNIAAIPLEVPARPDANPNAIPLDTAFRNAIEARLSLYSFLNDMKTEREDFMVRRPKMADAVKAELARQDRELDKIPTPEQAENMIEKRRAKQKDLMERIREAKAKDEAPPPKPSREMREAEEMAISQWTFCAQSGREALPAVYRDGLELMRQEPLTAILEAKSLEPLVLMGGAAYYLALEVLLEEAKYNRVVIRSKLAALGAPDEKKGGKGGKGRGMFGLFGMGSDSEEEEDEEDSELPTESYEELTELDGQLALRTAWITQEIAFMEKTLITEFWRLYTEVALIFLPDHERMPLPVRAFLRYGAIGFQRWWMSEEVRDHVTEDCTKEIVHHVAPSRDNTNVLYADEYLAAVMNWECTPAMDENLEINERNSPNWKADKALRKLINARSQMNLMEELVENLSERIGKLHAEAGVLDDKISKLLAGSQNYKQVKNELSQQRQTLKVEVTKLTNLSNRIKNETMAQLEEAVAETRERFDSGELPRPTSEFTIKRECDAIHKIGRLLANLKERFLPLVLRDNFFLGTDAVNDRLSIRGEILEMERRDPAIFLENIVPSKKKANRVDLRISPIIVLVPSAGVLAFSWNPRQKPEDGRLGIPTCFIRRRIRERQITYLLADFRWDTSKAAAGMDIMTSDTIVAAFMTVRWDWRKRSKEAREKGLIYTDQNDRTNWRRVYEAYVQTAYEAGKKLYNRNYDFYERIIGKYFDLPENVQLLRK